MKFSIAMATYNGGNYILEQLQSFEDQDYMPYELVICDDGSTDDTINIIKEFSKYSSFEVRLYENEENLGYAQNFAKAISLCKGEWIALSDHDDKWFVNKLSEIQSAIENDSKISLIIHDYILTDSNLVEKPLTKMERLIAAGEKPNNMISGCATVFHRSILNFILPVPSTGIAHDVWIHNFFNYIHNQKYVLDVPLMYYRRHGNNASASFESNDGSKSKLRKLLHYRVNNSLPGYINRIKHMIIVKDRLDLIDINYNYEKLIKDIQILTDRIRILGSGFPKRQLLVLKFYFNNGYSNFNGLISLVNDFLRLKRNENHVDK